MSRVTAGFVFLCDVLCFHNQGMEFFIKMHKSPRCGDNHHIYYILCEGVFFLVGAYGTSAVSYCTPV